MRAADPGKSQARASAVLSGLALLFVGLAVGFLENSWGRPVSMPPIPLVDPQFTNSATVRLSAAARLRLGTNVDMLDCYACHDKKEPVKLKFDANQNLIVPEEHNDIVMAHGRHNRNNNCFNCHNEANLELLQTRDGRELKLAESPPLCGSCHGPTYRDWQAGAHGRTGGYWNPKAGETTRELCVSCHNPHAPKFPALKPAPGPHPLRPREQPGSSTGRTD